MDVPPDDILENPFYVWVNENPVRSHVFYVPDTKIVPAILKKWGLRLNDLSRYNETDQKKLRRFTIVRKELVKYWGGLTGQFVWDPETSTVIADGVKLSVTRQKPFLGNAVVRFVRGWIGTPALTTYLLRLLRNETPNANNPFNNIKSKFNVRPDVTYLPELYQILGVQNFEQMNIKDTADWTLIWDKVYYVADSTGRDRALGMEYKYGNEREFIPILEGSDVYEPQPQSIRYLMKLPRVVLERLKQVVAHNRGSFPTQSLTKDSFQAMTNRLAGKDLISLCLSNKAFDKFCLANDQELFRRKLKEEFGVDYDENDHGYESPWALYKQMHTYFEFVVLEIPAQRDEAATYFVDSYDGKGRKPPIEQRLVTLVPPPAEELKNMIGGMWFIIFFPAAPELSFYAVCSIQGARNEKILVKAVFETNMVEKTVLKEDIIPNIAQPFMDLYWANNEDSFLNSIPAFHDLQATAWYQEMTGDDDVRVLRAYD